MIHNTIIHYMQDKQIKQGFLCEKTGLSRYCVRLMLQGKRKLSIEEYIRICSGLNVPYDYFFNAR